jgi:hypothetical protein
MGCPACSIDYDRIEREIESGRIIDDKTLCEELEKEDLFITENGLVIYCPSCRETIQRLKDRVAAVLRKKTISGIKELLDRAYEERKVKKAEGNS